MISSKHKEAVQTYSAEHDAGVWPREHRLEAHAVPTALPGLFPPLVGHALRYGNRADPPGLRGGKVFPNLMKRFKKFITIPLKAIKEIINATSVQS